MNIRKVRRKCNVRGCKCIDSFVISRASEFGNTIIICKSCLKDALAATELVSDESKRYVEKKKREGFPALFFNSKLERGDEPKMKRKATDEEEKESSKSFICDKCGKKFETLSGLKAHLRYCRQGENGAER